ncbi:hypothetical protein K491DRAFT_502406 [Lophiostoma macrostomum CBS 122681]|uniref:Very-long-chain 3-oxoacyl-CoA synthase n=1 Tax=Lophiostoma macrostomum CBS 122681 TaxID=1314788 RepID=A0A6A6T4F2_9PLEO|nr:hypothetical protein K491DRAFT_502406 [Lophiostoma macrostomum CBS 122681]
MWVHAWLGLVTQLVSFISLSLNLLCHHSSMCTCSFTNFIVYGNLVLLYAYLRLIYAKKSRGQSDDVNSPLSTEDMQHNYDEHDDGAGALVASPSSCLFSSSFLSLLKGPCNSSLSLSYMSVSNFLGS